MNGGRLNDLYGGGNGNTHGIDNCLNPKLSKLDGCLLHGRCPAVGNRFAKQSLIKYQPFFP